MDPLSEAVSAAARALPEGHLERLAQALEGLLSPGSTAQAVLEAAAAGSGARNRAGALSAAWVQYPALPGAAIALALRSAADAVSRERAEETIDIAWTGPATPSVPIRRTASIIVDLIDGSRGELLAVSFAAYNVPEVVTALAAAASRGVSVRLVLESTADSAGALRFDARKAFSALEDRARFYSWPADQRVSASGAHGALHAKAIVADGERALITSANLTGSALDVNMELGLLVKGGPIPGRLSAHFSELIARGTLREVT